MWVVQWNWSANSECNVDNIVLPVCRVYGWPNVGAASYGWTGYSTRFQLLWHCSAFRYCYCFSAFVNTCSWHFASKHRVSLYGVTILPASVRHVLPFLITSSLYFWSFLTNMQQIQQYSAVVSIACDRFWFRNHLFW